MAEQIDDNQEKFIKDAVQQFVDAQIDGQEPDLDEFVSKYPEFEHQIRRRISNVRKIDSLFASLTKAEESDFEDEDSEIRDDLVGKKIASFEIVEMIGRGGMGVVYLARDTKLDRSVAIKSMPAKLTDDSTARMRFKREAKSLASLNHPNIAVIHEIIEQDEGADFLVLEYVPGETLDERIAREPLELEQALSISRQIAEAGAAAHEKGVIHRDIKPGNIKITPDGRVKVLDFGLAKASVDEGKSGEVNVTQAGRVIGTPAYMSPEQARGQATDKRSDIWSFGCVLYEMLTATVLFKGETVSDTLANILQTEPDWQALPQGTPANIQVLLRRCLEKEPRRRLRDIGDIAIILEDTTIELQRPTQRTGPVEAGRAKPKAGSRRVLHWFITGVAVATVVFLTSTIALKLGRPSKEQVGKSVSQPIVKPIKAIVVLPFDNLSGDPEQEYFVDGMTDALSAELGKIKALRVISRTSAMRYKNTDKSVPEIAQELGVDAVIEGSVLKAGNDVRVTAQLVDGRTYAHLWSDNYTGILTNILALQSEVTLAIAREIEAELTPEEKRRITRTKSVKPEAYEAYLLGRHYLDKALEPDIDVAIEYFKRAIEIDSTYAIAYAGLADAYTYFGFADIRSPENTWPNARTAAEKALAIDEGLAEAHTSLAKVKSWFEWDWPGAESQYKRALEINPNSSGAHLWYARFLSAMERHNEAIAQVERALELDPYSFYVKFFRAWALHYAGQKNEAMQLVKNTMDSDPDHPFWYWCLTSIYASQGMYEQALTPLKTQIDLMGDDINDELGFLGYLYGRLGRKDEALRQLEALDELAAKGRYVSPVNRSFVYIGLDDKDQAIAWLEKGYERRAGFWMVFLKAYFIFDPLRDERRDMKGAPVFGWSFSKHILYSIPCATTRASETCWSG
jgi:serine/threonine protein kinase/tetratricopeptide (TPR) repeat protein